MKRFSKLLWVVSFFLIMPSISIAGCVATGGGTDQGNYGWGAIGVSDLAKSFTVSETCTITEISAHLQKTGSPADQVVFKIYTDSAGAPGTAEGSANGISVTGTGIATGTAWITITSGTHWLLWTRSGAYNGTDYYGTHTTSGSLLYSSGGASQTNWASDTFTPKFTIQGHTATSSGSTSETTSTSTENIINAYTHFYMWNFLAFVAGLCGTLYIWRRVR